MKIETLNNIKKIYQNTLNNKMKKIMKKIKKKYQMKKKTNNQAIFLSNKLLHYNKQPIKEKKNNNNQNKI